MLFWGLVLLACSYLFPWVYYKNSHNDAELMRSLPSDPLGITVTVEEPLRDDYLEKYRFYWYEMSQSNLHYDPLNLQIRSTFLGKEEIYPLIAKTAGQAEIVHEVTAQYWFDYLTRFDVRSS
ncbi:hypothetical protein [Enterococcus olivae]